MKLKQTIKEFENTGKIDLLADNPYEFDEEDDEEININLPIVSQDY